MRACGIWLLAFLFFLALSCTQSSPQPTQPSPTKNQPPATGSRELMTATAAIEAVKQRLRNLAFTPAAEQYVQTYLEWVEWSAYADESLGLSKSEGWYVLASHAAYLDSLTEEERRIYEELMKREERSGSMVVAINGGITLGTVERPYWGGASWFVTRAGDVVPHLRSYQNAYQIEWDILSLSAGQEPPEGRWLPVYDIAGVRP